MEPITCIDVDKRIDYAHGIGRDWTRTEIEEAVDVADGILKFVKTHGWTQGFRNNIAVDLSISCHYLGRDPRRMLELVLDKGLEDIGMYDDEGISKRFSTVEGYIDYGWRHCPADYYADRGFWKRISEKPGYLSDTERLVARS